MKREQGINPIRLVGAWTEGYALDHHILSSTYMGEDVYGHPLFDTTRTKLGEMLFQFKYRYKHDQLDSITVSYTHLEGGGGHETFCDTGEV